jgi:tetratricopeptide (TPR) repeat protein
MGTDTVTDDTYQQALAFFNAGNYRRCHDLVQQALAAEPDRADLLKLAGRCSMELNLDDAVEILQRAVTLRPDDVDGWQALGDALVDEGRTAEAADALRRAVTLRPNDVDGLIDLAHTLLALGDLDEAIAHLTRAAELEPGSLPILRSLVDMHRRADHLQEALDVATHITELQPDDVLATMDVADLNLDLGNLDLAVRAYHRLREIDQGMGLDDHEVYAYHGMIRAEMARERWRRVLDLAVDATRVDRFGLTTDALAFAVAQVFGSSDRPTLTRSEVEAALAAEQAEHRRLHTEALSF